MKKKVIVGFIILGLARLVQSADITFYSYGDCHYGADAAETNWVTRINQLAGTTLPAAFGGGLVGPARGVVALGDLINDGGNLAVGTNQWNAWKADYGVNGEGVCRYPVYENFGNHDLSASRFVQKDIITRNLTRPGLTSISTNGLHYSWDWDGVHFVALGVYPADIWATENTFSSVHNPEYALEFLKWDLANNVGDSGRPVIVTHHYDFFTDWWPSWQKLAYPRELSGYNVVLILHGHQGAAYGYNFQGYTVVGQNGSLNVVRMTTNNVIQTVQSTGLNTWGLTYQKSFTMPDLGRTWNPAPRNNNRNVVTNLAQLSWRTGAYVVSQDVYFGTSSGVVAAATSPEIAGLDASVTHCAIPAAYLPLQPNTEYFWRVDQANGDKPFSTGKVWSFKTQDSVRTNDVTFLFVSDIHYQDETLTANKNTVLAMNGISGTPYPTSIGGSVETPRGVVFGGDSASEAKQWQYNLYLTDYGLTAEKLLQYPVAGENNGNHDGGLGSVVANGIVARNRTRTNLTAISTNGLHCSWDWDGVHFVTLGVRPGVNTNPYNSHGSLEFLIGDLSTNVANTGKAVVLFQHFGVDDYAETWWTDAERAAYYDAIKNYNVIGIFHGHTHTVSIYKWQGIDVFHAPHMQFGGSVTVPVTSSQGFFAVHITSNRMTVAERKADGTWGLNASKSIYLSYESSGLPAIIANGVATNGAPGQAVLSGSLSYEATGAAPTAVTIHWGTQDGGTNELNWAHTATIGTQAVGSFAATISGLGVSQTIYYRCRASNSMGTVWAAATGSFVTSPAALVDNGAGATELTRTSARLNGTLLQTQTTPVEAFICWGPSDGGTNKLAWTNVASVGSVSLGAFSAAVSGLSADTRYYYRCYATNAFGASWADTSATFLTLSDRPTITTGSPISLSRLSAVLSGLLVSTGSAPATVSVYVGTTDGGTSVTSWDKSVSIGLCNEGNVSAAVTGLNEAQQYYYRFFASNAFGASWAETSATFTTWASSGPLNRWNDALFSTGDFNATGSGNFTWSDSAAWAEGRVPNQTNAVVSLEPRTDLGDTLITVDGIYTVGSITARQSGQATRLAGNGKLIFNAGTDEAVLNLHRRETRYATLRADAYVDMQLDSDLDLRMGASRQAETDCGRIGKTISGNGALTLTLGNHDIAATTLFKLGVAGPNTHQGGTTVRHISRISYGTGHGIVSAVQLNAVSTGAFGTGAVTLDGTGCTTTSKLTDVEAGRGLWVRLSANNAMSSNATLTLVSNANIALEIPTGVSQKVAAVSVDGTPVASGTYRGGDFLWLYGAGTLIVGSGGEPPAQAPEIGLLGSNGSAIANASTTLSQPLGTEFGEILWSGTLSVTNTFAITNSGTGTLTLSGAPVSVLGSHSADFTVIQPVSLTIGAGSMISFKIICDPSAVGVRTGLVSIASNDSDENPSTFSVRATGTEPAQPPPSTTLNLSFRQGDGGLYSANAATFIRESIPNTNFGSNTGIELELDYPNNILKAGLIAFPLIIGNNAGQIPPGAMITSATLTLNCTDDAQVVVTLHRMLKGWEENQATWSLLKAGTAFGNSPFSPADPGGGAPDIDYEATATASLPDPINVGPAVFNITSAVQAWANGVPNYGLYMRYGYDGGRYPDRAARFDSDDATTLANRPLLTVTCTVPSTNKGTVILFYLGQ